ncbi:MAG: 50S ribosomal protein L29 [Acidimicrobiia bacterium]|nr:50S ribosomal protein L29 [Acidimicrobiia bacterium]
MKAEKIRELSDEELKTQEREMAEQMFRLRFQLATGQTEGLKKLRLLKKDVARIKTIRRQRELGRT